jgi:polyhydroxybutyrate depolymerase
MHCALCLLLFLAIAALCSSPTVSAASHATSSIPLNIRTVNDKTLHYFNISRPEGVREFCIYLFDGYDASTPSPLAIYYHGFGGGYVQGLQLNMTDAADRQQYILALPHGTPSTESQAIGWNGGRCCLFPNGSQPEVDDVAFTAAMLKTIQQAFNVDAERVYAMGWSNGGYMTERLGCEAPQLFAGIAADASAVIIGDNNRTGLQLCDRHYRNASLNYLHFHGLNDPTVPWSVSI